MRLKQTAIATIMTFVFMMFAPVAQQNAVISEIASSVSISVADAAPRGNRVSRPARPQPRPKQQFKKATNPGKRKFVSMADRQRGVRFEKRGGHHRPHIEKHRDYRFDRRPHHPPRRTNFFWYDNRCYRHGWYGFWWGGRYRTLHSEDWIGVIGLSAFLALIASEKYDYSSSYSTDVRIIERESNYNNVIIIKEKDDDDDIVTIIEKDANGNIIKVTEKYK